MQEVTTFLTSHYHFCFNVLTEVTEVACLENDVPDPHLHYAKVLQTRTRRGVFRLCFRFFDDVFAPIFQGHVDFRHPVVRAYEIHSSFGHKEHDRLQSEPHSASVGRVHTVKGNVYRVVEC